MSFRASVTCQNSVRHVTEYFGQFEGEQIILLFLPFYTINFDLFITQIDQNKYGRTSKFRAILNNVKVIFKVNSLRPSRHRGFFAKNHEQNYHIDLMLYIAQTDITQCLLTWKLDF